ncbi:hypothetical protein CkaCkLH20_03076 [Colletotrichum karsti]|uniref:DNA2/NAM7 helicase helicase domain-containing protein n=1 Tax=Colletotrichum karsti TaxID=1095194 RepID=A0A9P6I999_9PEZI|nr:uncharacterized protein CkaCkLH20_03076 [Colletotrichum karsti]KAF9879533.1 hypothetical protein CkaCkLH20_03076 [Colletotrichum karsti]
MGLPAWEEGCFEAISHAVFKFDILVGAPFGVGQIGEYSLARIKPSCKLYPPWKPSLVVVDETGRIPEVRWWITVSVFPDAVILIIGDTGQSKPTPSSVRQLTDQAHGRNPKPEWKCVFGYKRTLSIFKRVEACDQILGHLSNDRRNRGDIANWAREESWPRS